MQRESGAVQRAGCREPCRAGSWPAQGAGCREPCRARSWAVQQLGACRGSCRAGGYAVPIAVPYSRAVQAAGPIREAVQTPRPPRALVAPLRVQPPVTVAALHRDTHASCYYSSAPLLSACGVSRGPDPPPSCRAQRRLPSGASSTRRRSARPTRCSRSSARSRTALCELERCCWEKNLLPCYPNVRARRT